MGTNFHERSHRIFFNLFCIRYYQLLHLIFFLKFDFQNVNVSRTDTQGMLYSFFNDYFHFGQIHKLKLIEDIDD